jgi:hypothetical protein
MDTAGPEQRPPRRRAQIQAPEQPEEIESETRYPRLQLTIRPNTRQSSPRISRPSSLLVYDINFNREVKTIPFESNRNN